MLKTAFNSLTRIHSREAKLKRQGPVPADDIYSPCRITPSNYFRFLRGPEFTTIHGREFVIPVDTMKGQFSQIITFDSIPDSGTYKLSYNSLDTVDLSYDADASSIQTELRLLPGLSKVTVSGDYATGFFIVFTGFSSDPYTIIIVDSSLENVSLDSVQTTVTADFQIWTGLLKRGDKLIDQIYGVMTIDEIVEIPDIGGGIMGFRIRAE